MKMWNFLKTASLILALVICLPLTGRAQGAAAGPGKPALYEFGSNYCAACKQMKEVLAAVKASEGRQVKFRLVNGEEDEPQFG